MEETLVDRSSIMALAAYAIADSKIVFGENTPLERALADLADTLGEDDLYVVQLRAAIEHDPSIGDITILRTSNGLYDSSPMAATCFRDGNDVYVQYRGTPDSGWVQNSISYGADINDANAADGVSSQIQVDGLDFFDACVRDYAGYGFSGDLIVGGHSQGGNVAEYVTIMSEYAALIDLCVSLDGPGHSKELYDYIIERYGIDYFNEHAQKILSINGNNDYVNMQGQIEFAIDGNVFYIISNDAWANENGQGGFWGWHDLLYLMDSETGGLLPYDAEQGPVGQMVADIVSVLNTLPQEQQEDSAMAIMAVLEMFLGSKSWEDVQGIGVNAGNLGEFLFSEEFIGFMAHGLPAVLGEVISNPALLAQVLNEVIPEDIKNAIRIFISIAPPEVVLAVLTVGAVIVAGAVAVGAIVIGFYQILDFVISVVQALEQFADAAWQAVITLCTAIKDGLSAIAEWFRTTFNAGVRYAAANPYFKADPDRLREYAARINAINRRLVSLDDALNGLYWQVGFLDLLDILLANLLTGGSPTLAKVGAYLDGAAERLESAENKACRNVGG